MMRATIPTLMALSVAARSACPRRAALRRATPAPARRRRSCSARTSASARRRPLRRASRRRLRVLRGRRGRAAARGNDIRSAAGGRWSCAAASTSGLDACQPGDLQGRRRGRGLPDRAQFHFFNVGYEWGGSYWKVHNPLSMEIWSLDERRRPLRRVRKGPKVFYCFRDLERTRPMRRSPTTGSTAPAARTRAAERLRAGHLGRLVGHLPLRLRPPVGQRRRAARLLRLRHAGRPAEPALRVQRAQQPLAPDRPPALPRAPSTAEARRGRRPTIASARSGRRSTCRPRAGPPSCRPPRSRVMSTTVEGRPVSSPPSIARSTASTIASPGRRRSRGRRLAGEVGRGLEERAHRARKRAADQAHAELLGVLPAGERVAALGVGDDQGHRAGQQRADRLARCAARGCRSARASPAARSRGRPRACRRRGP